MRDKGTAVLSPTLERSTPQCNSPSPANGDTPFPFFVWPLSFSLQSTESQASNISRHRIYGHDLRPLVYEQLSDPLRVRLHITLRGCERPSHRESVSLPGHSIGHHPTILQTSTIVSLLGSKTTNMAGEA